MRPSTAVSSSRQQPVVPFKTLASPTYGGRYQLGRFLGRGASATVWEAFHNDFNHAVAVKVFDQGVKDRNQARREMRALAQVRHPRILEAYEVIESSTHSQLICELIDGESLRTYTQRQPLQRLDEQLGRTLFQQVVDGIRFCHERLVVHRDLKLENLLLDTADTVKLIDFGFATQVASKTSRLRAFCGTPSYMAPEIVRGESYSGFSTDVWALGVILFAMLTGTLPFTGRSEVQLYAKIRRGAYIIPEFLSDAPKRLLKGLLRLEATSRPSAMALHKHPWLQGNGSQTLVSSSNVSGQNGTSISAAGVAAPRSRRLSSCSSQLLAEKQKHGAATDRMPIFVARGRSPSQGSRRVSDHSAERRETQDVASARQPTSGRRSPRYSLRSNLGGS